MSAMTNDPFKLARYAGYYKALQSAVSTLCSIITILVFISCIFGQGAAGSFGMDATKTPFLNEIVIARQLVFLCHISSHLLL